MGEAGSSESSYESWVHLTRDRAASAPDREAFTFLSDGEAQQVRWDYRHLDTRARAIAAHLGQTCQPGDRALLLYQPGPEFVAAFHACLYAGVIAVPAYPPRSAEHERALPRLTGILRDAGPAAVLTGGEKMLGVVRECVAAAGGNYATCADTESLPDALAGAWREPAGVNAGTVAFLQYTSGSTSTPKGVVVTHGNLLHNSAAIRDAFGHHPGSRGVIWLPPYHDMGLIGGILQPIFAGFPVTLMPPAAMLQRPLRWLKAVSDWRATTSGGPDFAFDLAVRAIKPEDRAGLDLSRWEVAYSGAEPVRQETLDRFAAAFAECGFRREAFYPCYGLAEATLFATGGRRGTGITTARVSAPALRENRVQPPAPGTPEGPGDGSEISEFKPDASDFDLRHAVGSVAATHVSCGQSIDGAELRIVDPHTRRACPPDRVGEVWLRGPSVARGYWRQPEATADTFAAHIDGESEASTAGGWLRTGDLGFVAGGELYVTGRLKDLIIVRGRNHYPNDLEHTAGSAHPALRPGGGAAFGVEAGAAEGLVIVHEVERTQRDADPGEVFAAIRDAVTVAHELAPHAVVLLKPGRLPRTSSGKVRRHACREAFLANADLGEVGRWMAPAPADSAPTDARERGDERQTVSTPAADANALAGWLVEKLAATLRVPAGEIDPAEPFARYGLDSASAVALSGEIAAELGLDLEATLFWDYPTIQALAGYLASARGPEAPTQIRAA